MGVFGPIWEDHARKIADNWDSVVADSDVTLVAGDTSWAMRLADAAPDLEYLAERPGRKIVIRGNHDYWWKREDTRRTQGLVHPSITLLQGRPLVVGSVGITGTRGWSLDEREDDRTPEQNLRIFNRELSYLRTGLERLPLGLDLKIAALHYPPFDADLQPNEFFRLLIEFEVDILVYGHIHRTTTAWREGDVEGVRCYLVAVDNTGFAPRLIVPGRP